MKVMCINNHAMKMNHFKKHEFKIVLTQLLSCRRFTIIGPSFCISEPDIVSTSNAKFGAIKCSTESCANFNTSTAN